MRRRLFQGLQQGVEGGIGNLVGLIENVNLLAVASRTIAGCIPQLADFVNATIGGGINFNDVHSAAGAYFRAGVAFAAGLSLGAIFFSAAAVQAHGQDAGNSRLPDATMSAEDIAVGDALLFDGIFEGARNVLLPDHIGKCLRTILTR